MGLSYAELPIEDPEDPWDPMDMIIGDCCLPREDKRRPKLEVLALRKLVVLYDLWGLKGLLRVFDQCAGFLPVAATS